jgi:trypsin-like peptidase
VIAEPSVQSLLVVAMANGQELGSGTGFVVTHEQAPYLITNYHVAAGRNPESGQPRHPTGAVPDTLVVPHLLPREEGGQITWEPRQERLLSEDGVALWLEHPSHGRRVDVVAVPLRNVDNAELHPYDVSGAAPAIALGPSSPVNIIGFPFGLTAGGLFAVWTRGFVASEPDVDFNDLPLFLVDARTRQGQSGSPVIAYSAGGMTPMADGSTAVFGGPVVNLLGVYSGRVNEESDLGLVWKLSALQAVLAAQKPGKAGLLP